MSGSFVPINVPEWDVDKTKLFLTLYNSRKHEFRDPCIKKRDLWQEIISVMEKECDMHGLDPIKADRKFRNLKQKYDNLMDHAKKYGTTKTSWTYFREMQQIYCDSPSVAPYHSVSSYPSFEENDPKQETNMQGLNVECIIKEEQSRSSFCSDSASSSILSVGNNISALPPEKKRKMEEHRQPSMQEEENLDPDERRLEVLSGIRDALERANDIQAERNELLKEYIAIQSRNN
ncbi:uncharacterized protein LOC115625741 [Scaptodrosophila lebanonensis]|uniref:Uncharacterized protein LOC115625741 n=1 Tax=Drosophila lebanonensis TaxID=7225 RepID=A0A6J2TJC3_DROLE|nr:uncharacterized protein LOC115625741 [Scaptodrosophila lebanonensis]XP_030376756.1 uncharacterized protein LOC115625741 [Scaptodrosophila lebanonensis]